MKKLFLLLLVFAASIASFAQFGYNPNSVRPVLEDDIMFRKTVTRRINLKEKQNRPFMAKGYEISDLIFVAVKTGKLQGYAYEIGVTDLMNKLDTAKDQNWNKKYDARDDQYYEMYAEDVSVLEIVEDVIFDKRRSRMYVDILVVSLIAPGADAGGQDKYMASFKYKDLDRYFREVYVTSNQKEALWYNPNNLRRHMCLADAFELRLFSSRILKVSNPEDKYLQDMYKEVEELYKAQEAEMELMEFEHNLWEF